MALSIPVPSIAARGRRQIRSVGGGKGGIGKSLLTASLGFQLARMGKRVILVDDFPQDFGRAEILQKLGDEKPAQAKAA